MKPHLFNWWGFLFIWIFIYKRNMKHLLNNLSDQEKNAIREQHTGGIKINTENFSKLVESKLGDSKPFVDEQFNLPQAASKPQASVNPAQPQYGGLNAPPQQQAKPQPQNVTGNDRISNIASLMATLQDKMVPMKVINNPASKLNGMSWNDYLSKYKISKQELDQATALLSKFGKAPNAQPATAKPATAAPPTAAPPTAPTSQLGGVSPTKPIKK